MAGVVHIAGIDVAARILHAAEMRQDRDAARAQHKRGKK